MILILVSDPVPFFAASSISFAQRAAKASIYLIPVLTPFLKASSHFEVRGSPRISFLYEIISFIAAGPHSLVFSSGSITFTQILLSNNCPVSYTHLRAHETRHDIVC